MDNHKVRERVMAAWWAHREAAEASRRASRALSLELAAAVGEGVTGYRLAKWLGVADSAVRRRLKQAQQIAAADDDPTVKGSSQ